MFSCSSLREGLHQNTFPLLNMLDTSYFGVKDTWLSKREKYQKIVICIFNWRPSWILGVGFKTGPGTQLEVLET